MKTNRAKKIQNLKAQAEKAAVEAAKKAVVVEPTTTIGGVPNLPPMGGSPIAGSPMRIPTLSQPVNKNPLPVMNTPPILQAKVNNIQAYIDYELALVRMDKAIGKQ